MAMFEDGQRTLIIGVISGLAAAGVVKYLTPAFSDTGRPLLKGLIKAGLMTYEIGREKLAVAGEVVEDLIAEVRAELDTETDGPARSAPHAAASQANGGA
jgi:Protein of unknown function (DUF5132)